MASRISPDGKKKRISWSDDEVRLFKQLVPKEAYFSGGVDWVSVAEKFPLRTNVNCKDKARQLYKSNSSQ